MSSRKHGQLSKGLTADALGWGQEVGSKAPALKDSLELGEEFPVLDLFRADQELFSENGRAMR